MKLPRFLFVQSCDHKKQVHARKRQIFELGEDLFGLPHQSYTQLDQTERELDYLSQLYDLYTAVLETIGRWGTERLGPKARVVADF